MYMKEMYTYYLQSRFIIYSIFILLILIFYFSYYFPSNIPYFLSTSSDSNLFTEGFGNYTHCMEEGYPLEFCAKTPVETNTSYEYCSCADGYFGSWHMDDGKCYCYLQNGLLPKNFYTPFASSPFD